MLGRSDLKAGRIDSGRAHLRAVLDDPRRGRRGAKAFTLLGKSLLDARLWAKAAAHFEPSSRGAGRRGETALVGLLRARIGQGRLTEARALVDLHRQRHPSGARRSEIQHLAKALGLD